MLQSLFMALLCHQLLAEITINYIWHLLGLLLADFIRSVAHYLHLKAFGQMGAPSLCSIPHLLTPKYLTKVDKHNYIYIPDKENKAQIIK